MGSYKVSYFVDDSGTPFASLNEEDLDRLLKDSGATTTIFDLDVPDQRVVFDAMSAARGTAAITAWKFTDTHLAGRIVLSVQSVAFLTAHVAFAMRGNGHGGYWLIVVGQKSVSSVEGGGGERPKLPWRSSSENELKW